MASFENSVQARRLWQRLTHASLIEPAPNPVASRTYGGGGRRRPDWAACSGRMSGW